MNKQELENYIKDLAEKIDGIENITKLYLRNENLSNIEPLKQLSNLETLFLDDNEIVDISPLRDLGNLKWICLYNNKIEDLSPLANIVDNLDHICLSNNPATEGVNHTVSEKWFRWLKNHFLETIVPDGLSWEVFVFFQNKPEVGDIFNQDGELNILFKDKKIYWFISDFIHFSLIEEEISVELCEALFKHAKKIDEENRIKEKDKTEGK